MRSRLCLIISILIGSSSPVVGDDPSSRYTESERNHWSFQKIQRPPVPPVQNATWCRNEIDRFVLAKLEERGWTPAPPPSASAWLRRVTFDLTGLPPTIGEQDRFLADPSPEAMDRVVEDLLARPAFGERWARHWLDLVRFAESNGYERDATKPNAWKYRDYVIRAMNDDKPYDRFLLEQIAGDELPDSSAETMIATGFARLGPWDDEPADPMQDRFDQLDDIVAVTSEVAMGLTMACARCHDHKFEPLSQVDYYRMVAIFDPLVRPTDGRTELDLPVGTRSELEALELRDLEIARNQKKRETLLSAPPTPNVMEEVARLDETTRLLRQRTPDLPRGYILQESSTIPTTHVLSRGQASSPGDVVQPGFPAILSRIDPEFPEGSDGTSGRRLALARWLTHSDHPLTARVIVNRVWQYHFGKGIVGTPSDFGTGGDPPTHPELLDWLADWFVNDAHWSLKKLHRLILTSQTSRMGKAWREDYAQEDPENEMLWRLPYRRLEVEAIRDAMLLASGQLNPAMYGPSMFPEVPKGSLEGNSDPDKVWKASDEREASRRTIYAFVKRSLIIPMLEVLDFCDTTRSSPRRLNTSTAPQALSLFNGRFVNRQAEHLADRLLREAGTKPGERIDLAFRLTLGRHALEHEIAAFSRVLQGDPTESRDPVSERDSLTRMARIIFNLNEFCYTD